MNDPFENSSKLYSAIIKELSEFLNEDGTYLAYSYGFGDERVYSSDDLGMFTDAATFHVLYPEGLSLVLHVPSYGRIWKKVLLDRVEEMGNDSCGHKRTASSPKEDELSQKLAEYFRIRAQEYVEYLGISVARPR